MRFDGNEVYIVFFFLGGGGCYLFVRSYVDDMLIWKNWLENLDAPMMMI